jgi:enoyl-CoA hydratase
MPTNAVQFERNDAVAIIRLDDGKANALSPDVIAGLESALERAEAEARAVLLVGRPGRFSAGFDLSVMREGSGATVALVTSGGELALRLYGFPHPVVVACTGHAVAMGAIILLSADLRLGAEGSFKICLNEVAIGLTVPIFGVELARDRLSKRHLTRATETAEAYDPSGALDAGFLDRVTSQEALFTEALGEAQRLAGLDTAAFAGTKRRLRSATIAHIRETLQADVEHMVSGGNLRNG